MHDFSRKTGAAVLHQVGRAGYRRVHRLELFFLVAIGGSSQPQGLISSNDVRPAGPLNVKTEILRFAGVMNG